MTDHDAGHVWAIEQVVAFAGSSARFGAGEAVAVPPRWSRTGSSERALWGRYHGSGAEPYDVSVDHIDVGARCTCPSRAHPCKHIVALLVLWVRGHVPRVTEPAAVAAWIDRQHRRRPERDDAAASADVPAGEPWLDRVPALVTAAITRREDGWVLTDHQGSLPIATESMRSDAVATLLAASGGRPVTVALEWTPRGVVPLTVFLDDRSIDIGPRADPNFVSAA